MPTITSTERTLRWTVVEAGAVIESGDTQPGETTIAADVNTLLSDADENALLGALTAAGVSAPPLPDVGADLRQGDIYDYNGTLVMVRQSHTRTTHDPADVPALFVRYRPDAADVLDWIAGEQVYVGTRRVYEGVTYEVLQAHVTQADWTPDATPALWQEVVEEPPTGEWVAGVAYVGDNTAGAGNGDVVTYQGHTYRCLQSHTSISTWTPTAVPALWLQLD